MWTLVKNEDSLSIDRFQDDNNPHWTLISDGGDPNNCLFLLPCKICDV